ncbi:hypothetical protein ABH940_005835 [Streptacidiphilus sp. BW17]|uniref:hypothetical protein n=1 Tax=Streptacidiphilus sp. BW17 TaxID=3156274 RepID=UPI00351740F6
MNATQGPVPAEYEPIAGPPGRIELTSAQLHGRACVVCGSERDSLTAAGHAYTCTGDGGRLGWPVKACARHVRRLDGGETAA